MPIIILITVGLFVSGHLSIGAAVAMKVQLAGDNIEVDNFFEFSMAKSTYDTWVAGAKELAILIILFSGLWPYTKQFTVLYLWMTPPSCVTMETRGSVFQWLDTLGKWSMIDIFVLVMSLVAFQIDVSSPIYDFLPDDFYGLKLQVVPLWGLYSNLLAQIVSQISSHFIIKYHRNICAAKEQEQQRYELRVRKEIAFDGDDDEKIKKQEEPSRRRRRLSTWVDMHGGESLFTQSDEMTSLIQARTALRDHIFRVAANPESERNGRTWQRFRLKKRMSGFVVILGMATIAILSWGMITDSLALEVWGILGVAIDIGEPGASYTKHSVYSIVTSVINQAFEMWHENMGLAMGQFFLAMIFSLCCYIVPVLQVILLCVMWTKPMRLKSMKRCYVMNEILSAWQYMEVYLVAVRNVGARRTSFFLSLFTHTHTHTHTHITTQVLLAIFQLGQISSYMMNEQCLSMNSGFQMLVDSDMIEEKDAQCFYLYAEAMIGSYILLGSAFLLCILNQLVGGAAVAAIEDREYRAFQTANRLNNTAGSGAICGNPGPGAETFRWVLTMSPTLFGVGSRLRRRGWLSEDLNNTIMIVDGDRSIVSDSVNLCDGDAVQYKDIESGAVKKSKWEVLVELNFFGTEHLMYFDTHTGRLYSTRPSSSVEDKKVDVVSKAPFARVVKKDQRRRRSSASDSPCASGHILVSRSARARSVRWGSNESPLVKNIIDKVDMQGQFTPPPPFSMSKHRHARKIEMARRDAPVHIPSPPSFSSSDYDRDVMEKKKKIPPPIVPRTKRPLIAAPPKPIVQLQDVVLAPSLPSKRNKKKVNKSKSRPRPPPVPVRKKRGACGNYRLDLSADYGLCKCGFPKNEHISNSYYYHH